MGWQAGGMGIEVRRARAEDLDALLRLDERAFALDYDGAKRDDALATLELDRFVLAFDGAEIVGATGVYSFELTVPGGATATLAPGQAQTVGDYRVLHGTTTTVERFPPRNAGDTGCADLNAGSVELTAVLQATEP